MKRYQRLGVFLYGAADDETLAMAGRVATVAESEVVHLVYQPPREDSGQTAVDDPETTFKSKLPEEVAAKTTLTVTPGNPVQFMLQLARDESLDMVVVGRRLLSGQVSVGTCASRLARKAPCTVFIVPEQMTPHLSRVLVPVDFSDHSRVALEIGIQIAKCGRAERPQVVAQSVFSVGYGYSKMGLTLEAACQKMEEVTRQKLEEFVQGLDTSGVDFELVCTNSEREEAAIAELAKVRKMDLVCVGSRGATSDAVALLGGTTERLVATLADPVLVVKNKGETVKFLDVLLGR